MTRRKAAGSPTRQKRVKAATQAKQRQRKAQAHVKARRDESTARNIVWLGNDLYEMESDTTPGRRYQLAVHPNGLITCQCPNYKKHRGRLCKHGRRIKALHDSFTNEQRALWPAEYRTPLERLRIGNPILDSQRFYKHNVRRRKPPTFDFADGGSLISRREQARTQTATRGMEILVDVLGEVERSESAFRSDAAYGRSPIMQAQAVVLKATQNVSLTTFIQRRDATVLLGDSIGVRSMCRYTNSETVRDILRYCLPLMAISIRELATHLVVDSSGFPTLQQINYRNDDKGRAPIRPYAVYVRGHVLSCAASGVIVAFLPTYSYGTDSSDHSQLRPLLRGIEGVLKPRYVLADKAYFSDEHMLACDELGAMFICPPKKGWTPRNSTCRSLAQALYDLYHAPDGQFDDIYSWRAKAETVFSTIEQLFSKAIRARGAYGRSIDDTEVPLSMEIELLAKCVAHNIARLVYLESELGQRVSFSDCRSLRPLPRECLTKGRSLLVLDRAA